MDSMGDRSMQFSSYVAPVMLSSTTTPTTSTTPTTPTTQAQPQAQPKTMAALATWCGFSKKAMKEHKDRNLQGKVQELLCDKGDKDHPLCKKTKGFPTYYKPDGTVLKRGFPVQDPKGFYGSL